MKQIRQRLRMHVPVLDRYLCNQADREVFRMRKSIHSRVADTAQLVFWGRPVAGRIPARLTGRRIDTAFEQPVEFSMRKAGALAAAGEKIPIECFKVPQMKDEPVPLGYWPS